MILDGPNGRISMRTLKAKPDAADQSGGRR